MKGQQQFLFLLLCLAAAALPAQQPPHPERKAYDGADALNAPMRIYVDQDCRILPDPLHPTPGLKQKPYRDGAICHIDSPSSTVNLEQRTEDNQLIRWDVVEETLQVTNLTDREVVFVVSYLVQKPWFIDSDPKPVRYEGNNAIFLVHVSPGRRVGLHVGRRIMRLIRPKPH